MNPRVCSGKPIHFYLVALCVLGARTASPAAAPTVGRVQAPLKEVTLASAIDLTLSRNPAIKAAQAAFRAAAARARQAGFQQNPEIEAEIEDIGLSGEGRGFDGSVYTVRVAQLIELGGKRAKRRLAASLEAELARWDLEAERLDLAAAVKIRFIDLLAAQERVRIVAASHELGRKVRNTAAERVRSGKVSPLELTKAEVELTGRRVELRRAERRLAAAKTALAALWNAAPGEVSTLRAAGDLGKVPRLPDLATLEAALGGNPRLARWTTERKLARAVVARQQADRVPDVTLSAGIAYEQDGGNELVEFAFSLPLPLFDRNRGNIAAALAEVDRARQEQRAVALALHAELVAQWQELQATAEEAASIADEMLPGARDAFRAARQAYRSGKIEYLDVLDAQQTLFEVEMQWLDARAALHRAAARVERLVGGSLNPEERENR